MLLNSWSNHTLFSLVLISVLSQALIEFTLDLSFPCLNIYNLVSRQKSRKELCVKTEFKEVLKLLENYNCWKKRISFFLFLTSWKFTHSFYQLEFPLFRFCVFSHFCAIFHLCFITCHHIGVRKSRSCHTKKVS